MSTTKAAGIGKSLRDNKKISFDVSVQTPIANKPFDPIASECAIIEAFSTWCGPCIRLIPVLMKHALHYKNIPILQISPEEPEKLKKFFGGVKVPNSVSAIPRELWDSFSDWFSIQGIPHLVVLHKGVAVFSGHPMDPELEPLLKKLNAQLEAEKKEKETTATIETAE